ncbi:class I SAM-dependent methyltransferase [Albidovulum sediminicola]|uniref:Methyltransferase type 12 n=1 Tax=Albidovulum sediminicola TaxID=2984331 RepID=A0ABT2Z6M5_9RHOB|nr:methyltransferase domain-containing protein [Defluviimonas sp. WL0075]MCV2866783.1 methyltransferase type 12 [Defluviimonas sp. WL0075]
MSKDLSLFIGQLLRNPREISAVVPSSRALAMAMAAPLGPGIGPVAEFGPGTGRITREILARGVSPRDLVLYEMNGAFCERLRQTFPAVRVVNRPAQDAARDFAGRLGAVVSGLPLLSIPEPVQRDILAAAFKALAPGGIFIQFTYGPKPPVAQEVRQALGISALPGPRVWHNLPPARVYIYRRAAENIAAM